MTTQPQGRTVQKRRSCGRDVAWYAHENSGKRAPINAEPVLGGNVELDDAKGTWKVVTPDLTRFAYTNHFGDCSQSKQWRKGAK